MITRPHIAAALILSLLEWTSYADTGSDRMKFSRLDIEDGLSQNTVLDIKQDSRDNIWFATADGLNRYDSYDITVFRHKENDTSSIAGNNIRKLFLDSSDRMWIGTSEGLSLYDSKMERFENFGTKSRLDITAIEEISGRRLLVGTSGRLYSFDTNSGRFITDIPETMSNMAVTAMTRRGSTIYIGTDGKGLYSYSVPDNEFRRISAFQSDKAIQCILPQEHGPIYIGTEGDGLFILDPDTYSIRNFKAGGKPGDIGSNYVRSLAVDNEGRLWVGTFSCLDIYDAVTEKFHPYTNDAFDDCSLSQNSVRSICRDSQGGMWLGTFYGGVNYWHPLRERFTNIQRKPDGSSLNDNIISCIVEDMDGTVWIGTNSGGVNHYNPATGSFVCYDLSGSSSDTEIESNDIKAILIDGDTIYIGAHAGGLKKLDKASGAITLCSGARDDLPLLDVYSLAGGAGSSIWVGALQGLYLYDTKTGKFTRITEDADGKRIRDLKVRTIFRDSEGRLWIGGENGIQIFSSDDLSPYIPGNAAVMDLTFILGFKESSSGTIWAGTRYGLYGYTPETGILEHFTAEDGLPSDIIHGIEEDSFGRIWISTDNGLSCLNPYSGSFRNFTSADGLPSNQFTTYSHCRRKSGEMYFGGINGITVFTPERLTDNPYTPSPTLSRLQIFNKTILPGDDSGILDRSISGTSRIRLKHSQNSFSIDFTVTDYIAGRHNTFAYMLEGIDNDWLYTTENRRASYSRVPEGKYRFIVKSANNDGKWCKEPTILSIKILPIWYRTIWAHIIFLITGIGIIVGGIRFYLERKDMEARLELDRKDREHQEEMHQMKTRFFINISHELRTPLTLIVTPLQEMIAKASDVWMRKQLKYVYRNSQRLLNLVNQLMDYRRAELGVFKLKVRKENVHRIIRENWEYYVELARHKNLKYTLDSDLEDKTVYADGQYLELILNNLISNAFKYTDAGSVSVKARLGNDNLVIEVSDTGTGIAASEQDRIFERFYQLDDKHVGSGIGLSLVYRLVELHHGHLELESEEGRGSTFRVLIPQDLTAYTEKELDLEGTEKQEVHTTNPKEMYIIESEKQPVEESHGHTAKDSGNILIVEDDDDIRSYMENGLSVSFNTFTASNGQEALEIIGREKIDLVVTDAMMPVMDGYRLCSRIRQDSGTRHMPVIMLSAKAGSNDALEALHSGADDYISKPFSLAVLKAKINNMLKVSRTTDVRRGKGEGIDPVQMAFNEADEIFLKQAVDVVRKNMDNNGFSTEDFAREMNISRSSLHMKLKRLAGGSALDFIHRVRFQEACRLLTEGSLTISQIADRTGFNTSSYFSSCFKRYFGCLPSEYARLNKSDNDSAQN